MNPSLFRKLVETKLITTGSNVAVEYPVYQNLKKVSTVKGLYKITRMYSHPLLLGPKIQVTNDTEVQDVEPQHIKLIEGQAPVKLAAQHGIRPDGNTLDAPKRRGRKPKVRFVEPEVTTADFSSHRPGDPDEEPLDDEDDDDEVFDDAEGEEVERGELLEAVD